MKWLTRIRNFTKSPEVLEKRSSPNYTGRYGYGSSLTAGGIVNPTTGLGTSADKSEASFFTPTRIWWRTPLEILYVQSWAAANFVDIPIDDMFIRWRKFMAEGGADNSDTMEKAERKHMMTMKLATAMKAARVYGTGLVVMMTKEAPMETPLIPERIRPGDLTALRAFDRYDASVTMREYRLDDKNYGQPIFYDLTPSRGGQMRVHHSRVLRFNGIMPPTDSGFTIYEQDWGVSRLIPVIISVMQDQVLASGISHLSQEASMSVLEITGLREILAGEGDPGDPNADDIGSQVNRYKSIYNLLMLDKGTESFDRVAVQFAGLADLMDKFSKRVAAAARIPITRFMGMSPAGLNATGDSDMKNYIMMMEAERERMLPDSLEILDQVIARDAGLKEAPEYEWQSLLEMSELEQAEVAVKKTTALKNALEANAIDEDEYRRGVDGDPVFGELPGSAPELPDPEPMPVPNPNLPPQPNN